MVLDLPNASRHALGRVKGETPHLRGKLWSNVQITVKVVVGRMVSKTW